MTRPHELFTADEEVAMREAAIVEAVGIPVGRQRQNVADHVDCSVCPAIIEVI